MIDDLFSHKVHADDDLEEWQRTLVKVAEVYRKLDGTQYDQAALESQLRKLTPDSYRSALRDQFSMDRSVFGMGQISYEGGICRIRSTETAKRFLTVEDPDVPGFLRLQLALYQRPDARGINYLHGSHEHSSATEKLSLIASGYRVSPLRLIIAGLWAKAEILSCDVADVELPATELYTLANHQLTRNTPVPTVEAIATVLRQLEKGELVAPYIDRKTFKFLEATDLISVDASSTLSLKVGSDDSGNSDVIRKLRCETILAQQNFFDGFAHCKDPKCLVEAVKTGGWNNYFDAVKTLTAEDVAKLTDLATAALPEISAEIIVVVSHVPTAPPAYPFKPSSKQAGSPIVLSADLEQTRIKRERRNTYHDLILQRLSAKIEAVKLTANSTSFIDLYTNVPNVTRQLGHCFAITGSYLEDQKLPYFQGAGLSGVSFIFEAKSSDSGIVESQTRRAVSQLYEYRYRYAKQGLETDAVLVIALQERPKSVPWLEDYLINDRRIGICWLDENLEKLICPQACYPLLQSFVDGVGSADTMSGSH